MSEISLGWLVELLVNANIYKNKYLVKVRDEAQGKRADFRRER